MNTDNILDLASQTVDKCLQKSRKVVISSIIHREDENTLGVKAEIVNANLKYRDLNNPNV